MSTDELNHLDTPAWSTISRIVRIRLREREDPPVTDEQADIVVELLFDLLREPDRDMIDAGVAELDALTSRRRSITQRDLVARIFTAMLDRAS